MQEQKSLKEFFSKHAQDYAKSDSHAHGSDLGLFIERLEPQSLEVALDVATGTGFTAMELAKKVKQVVAIDITDEMLAEADRLAKEKGITNIRFERGDAANIPFGDSSFDIVTTRRAAHHFTDVPQFLREAHRVLKPSGRLGIVDMSPPEGTQDFFNKIEILRDSTHTRALTPDEWRSKIEAANLSITQLETLGERVTFERWLYPVKLGGSEEKEIREEWAKAPQDVRQMLGLEEESTSKRVESFIKTRIIMIAKKEK